MTHRIFGVHYTGFENLAEQVGLKVIDCVALHDGKPVKLVPNWRGSLAIFRLQKKIAAYS